MPLQRAATVTATLARLAARNRIIPAGNYAILANCQSLNFNPTQQRNFASKQDDDHSTPSPYGKHPPRLDEKWDFKHELSQGSDENVPQDYRPGADTYDYDNPWPKLNKGRLDWLFDDGWRRPAKLEEGGYPRKSYIPFGSYPDDPYHDWLHWHVFAGIAAFMAFTPFILVTFGVSNQIHEEDWNQTEAFLEMERREKAGLPYISPDLLPRERVMKQLPTDEELGDFRIII